MARQSKKVDWSAVQTLASSGVPLREIARRLGINQNTVLQRARRGGWNIAQLHGPGATRRSREVAKANQLSAEVVQIGRDYFQDAAALTRFNLARATANASTHLGSMDGEELIDRHQALSSVSKSAASTFGWNTEQNQNSTLLDRKFSLKPYQVEAWAQREREGWSLQQIEHYLNNLSAEENARLQQECDAKYAKQVHDIDP